MNTIDFSKCRHIEEFASTIKETFPKYTKKERKRFAYEIMNNTKKRVFTFEEFNLIVKDSEESKKFYEKQSGKEKNNFTFPYEFDEVRMSYLMFLNREDHNNKKEFQYMTEHEWIDYFVKQFNYPKPIAKKCGVSMYKYLRERSLDITSGKIDKYPLHPLLEDK
jgi:hypothetical protein